MDTDKPKGLRSKRSAEKDVEEESVESTKHQHYTDKELFDKTVKVARVEGDATDTEPAVSDADITVPVSGTDSDGVSLFKTAMAELSKNEMALGAKLLRGALHELLDELKEAGEGNEPYQTCLYLGYCWSELATVEEDASYYKDALFYFEKALEKNKDSKEASLHRAMTFLTQAVSDQSSTSHAPTKVQNKQDFSKVQTAIEIFGSIFNSEIEKLDTASHTNDSVGIEHDPVVSNESKIDAEILFQFASTLTIYSIDVEDKQQLEVLQAANKFFKVSLGLNPNHFDCAKALAKCLLSEASNYIEHDDGDSAYNVLSEALRVLERAAPLATDNKSQGDIHQIMMDVYVNLADVCPEDLFETMKKKAIEHLDKVKVLLPNGISASLERTIRSNLSKSAEDEWEDEEEDEEVENDSDAKDGEKAD